MIRDLPLEPSEVWPHTLQVHKQRILPRTPRSNNRAVGCPGEVSGGSPLRPTLLIKSQQLQLLSSQNKNDNQGLGDVSEVKRACCSCRAAQHSAHNRLLQRVRFTGNKHAHACVCRPPYEFFNLPILLPCITSQHSFPSLHTHNFFF